MWWDRTVLGMRRVLIVVATMILAAGGEVAGSTDVAAGFTQETTDALPIVTATSPNQVASPAAGAAVVSAGRVPCQAVGTLIDTCLDSGMSIFSQVQTYIPPDPHGAVGPTTLIAVTNSQIESLHKTTGKTIFGPTPLSNLFSSLQANRPFDTKIVYDVHRRRFVIVALDKTVDGAKNVLSSRILVAVSKNAVPRTTTSSDWHFLQIDALVDGLYWADYPGIAVDEQAIYITTNMFVGVDVFAKSLVWIVAKFPLYSGRNASVNHYDYKLEANGGFYGTHAPAMVRSATGVAPNVGTYLVMYDGITNNGIELLSIVQIDSPLRNPVFRQAFVDIGDVEANTPVPLATAPQKDPLRRGALIAVNNRRVLGAVWAQNHLWLITTVRDPSGETSALWVKLNATGVDFPPTVVDRGYINGEDVGAGTYTFFPSLDVNSKGLVAFGFSASSGRIYPSAYAAIRDDAKDPAGKVRAAMLVKRGEAPYYVTLGGPRNRWGDYSAMMLDPSNETCFWAFNQYAGLATYTTSGGQFGSWKTAWARLCYPGPPVPCKALNKVCTIQSQCCQPSNKVCDGPVGSPKRCMVCLSRGVTCSRTAQCCAGLGCKRSK